MFTSDWFTMHIPSWERILAPLLTSSHALSCLEIGTHEGRAACWIARNLLTRHEASRLVCVDPLEDQTIHDHWVHSISHLPNAHQVSLLRCPLYAVSPHPPVFDFVYVDGDHHAASVAVDGILAFRQMKVGGIMIFDDYEQHRPDLPRPAWPKCGVNFFLSVTPAAKVIDKGYQVAVIKSEES